jgi:hypothetical protein
MTVTGDSAHNARTVHASCEYARPEKQTVAQTTTKQQAIGRAAENISAQFRDAQLMKAPSHVNRRLTPRPRTFALLIAPSAGFAHDQRKSEHPR